MRHQKQKQQECLFFNCKMLAAFLFIEYASNVDQRGIICNVDLLWHNLIPWFPWLLFKALSVFAPFMSML
jgi:hypothetical protein